MATLDVWERRASIVRRRTERGEAEGEEESGEGVRRGS